MSEGGSRSRSETETALNATRLVARLQNLYLGPRAMPEIVRLREVAVPALEACLREPSQSLHHPRALAADALALIGGEAAIAALVRALQDSTARELRPLFREAEEVVVSHIAEHLTDHRSAEVITALLEALRARPNSACARALGGLGDPRAIPVLVNCLREDTVREAAMTSLYGFGLACAEPLRALLSNPELLFDIEAPTHIDARAAAATMLARLGDKVSRDCALRDPQRLVRIAAAKGMARTTDGPSAEAIEALIQGLDTPDWACAQELINLLSRWGSIVIAPIELLLTNHAIDKAAVRRQRHAAILAGRLGVPAAPAILASLHLADDPQLRLAAVDALAEAVGSQNDQVVRFLCDRELIVAARALEMLMRRYALTPAEISHQLKLEAHWRPPFRRWWRVWRLLRAHRHAGARAT